MKMLQLVAFTLLIALFGIGHADVINKPISVNALAPALVAPVAPEWISNIANEQAEWAEYKVFGVNYTFKRYHINVTIHINASVKVAQSRYLFTAFMTEIFGKKIFKFFFITGTL